MGKKAYIGAQGTAQQARKIYVGTGKARMAKKAYLGDENGIARLVFTSGAAWLKYTAIATERYYYVQDDRLVGQRRGQYDFYMISPSYATQYEFDSRYGFASAWGYPLVTLDNAVGAYEISDTEVWQVTSVASEPTEVYPGSYQYLVEGVVVASASQELDRIDYSKGTTSHGTIYAEDGQQPEAGEVLEHGSDHYVIRTASGTYWYQLVKED